MFIRNVAEKFPYAIECIQTDNRLEFTYRLNAKGFSKQTLFERTLSKPEIKHKLLRPFMS